VVIIGSGVAYGLGNIPTQKPFWDNLKDFIAKRPESKIFEHLKEELKDDLSFEDEKLFERDGIETQFSKLHDLFYSQGTSLRVRTASLRLMIFFRKEIVAWLSHKQDYESISLKSSPQQNGWEPGNTTFVSFNYDELFEDLFIENNYIHYRLDELSDNKDKFVVLKPHGSLTWMEKRFRPDSIFFKSSNPATINRHLLKEIRNFKSQPIDVTYFMKDRDLNHAYTPLIVPFYKQKRIWFSSTKWGALLGGVFFKFVKSLAQCKNLWIIGYGMPKADWMITEALCALNDVKVTIVGPQGRSKCCGWKANKPFCHCSGEKNCYVDKKTDLYSFLSKNKSLDVKVIDQCAYKFFQATLKDN